MKNKICGILAAVLTAIMLFCTVIPASAQDAAAPAVEQEQTAPSVLTDSEQPAQTDSAQPAEDEPAVVAAQKLVTPLTYLSDEAIEAISDRLSSKANIYPVTLQDGRVTYYIQLDLRDDDYAFLAKLAVMRATAHKLYARSEEMAKQADTEQEPLLMSYSRIIGELTMHFTGYRITKALGGEKLPGLLGKVYRSCSVADLNVDEGRMAVFIRLLGMLLG